MLAIVLVTSEKDEDEREYVDAAADPDAVAVCRCCLLGFDSSRIGMVLLAHAGASRLAIAVTGCCCCCCSLLLLLVLTAVAATSDMFPLPLVQVFFCCYCCCCYCCRSVRATFIVASRRYQPSCGRSNSRRDWVPIT